MGNTLKNNTFFKEPEKKFHFNKRCYLHSWKFEGFSKYSFAGHVIALFGLSLFAKWSYDVLLK
jgi:hypothetical protein